MLFVLTYVVIACARLAHPFELEWLEGAMLEHVARVLDGDSIYVPPSMDFVPFLYAPFYYFVSAGVSLVTGAGFPALRLVSLAASLGLFTFIYLIVAHETNDRFAGAIALGLSAATFAIGGGWFDIGRNDSLFLLLAAAGIYTLRRRSTPAGAATAGLLFALAALTKQSAVLIAASLGLYLLLVNWRHAAVFGAAFGLVAGGTAWIWDVVSDGWFSFYVWDVPRDHALIPATFLGFWTSDLLGSLPIGTIGGLGFLAVALTRRHAGSGFLLALTAGCLAAAWSSRLHTGSFTNVVIPAYLALAILLSIALHGIVHVGGRPQSVLWLAMAGYAVVGVQFLLLVYNPLSYIPDAGDRIAGERLVAEISSLPGTIWIPGHGYLATRAGKPASAHGVAIHDVLRAGDSEVKQNLTAELAWALSQRRYNALVMDSRFPKSCPPRQARVDGINWFCSDIHAAYQLERTLLDPEDGFWPVVGVPSRPAFLFRPRSAPAQDP